MAEVNNSLRDYIEREIMPRYQNYDEAHRRDHIDSVVAQSLVLAAHYDVDTDMVYTVAAYHDLGAIRGRELHHIYSGEMLAADVNLRRWFTEEQIVVMREAVEDHRASSTHAPRSVYGCIVAEADRQIEPDTTLRRTVQYGLAHYPEMDRGEQFERFVEHLRKKYGPDGYLKLYIPYSDNAARLAELRRLMASPEELSAAFGRIYDELTKTENNG